ncbi:hypothetical protein [Pseudofrankia asymbiotica]|uniref:Uncharacterized protein n=1 Tax=Pseudofrankia asymbiotica TaxID=1834516 RepID=A0A1V2I3E6_9ACTN|nr:hypothetical protein [Pseudofrankia asymbiotica]ONH24875.1 hypothetical protein BL253_28795 [Pseudofrankia asymbiotica]
MSFTSDPRPAVDLGPLTVGDLALRSDKAHAEHLATYTAATVLHEAFMSMPAYDEEAHDLVDAACRFIREYREKTYTEWRSAYRAWATAAGFEIPPEMTETTPEADDTDDAESEV